MAAAVPSHLKIVPVQRDADLQRYLDDQEFRLRMRVNLVGAVILSALLALGIWLADKMVETQKVQGCYASGAHSCSLM
jgi:hypothetical protein